MADIVRSMDFLKQLADVLGMSGHPLQKVVIEIPCDGIVRVFTKGLCEQKVLPVILDGLKILMVKDVTVDDYCNVHIVE